MATARNTMEKRMAKRETWDRIGREKKPSVNISSVPELTSWAAAIPVITVGIVPTIVLTGI